MSDDVLSPAVWGSPAVPDADSVAARVLAWASGREDFAVKLALASLATRPWARQTGRATAVVREALAELLEDGWLADLGDGVHAVHPSVEIIYDRPKQKPERHAVAEGKLPDPEVGFDLYAHVVTQVRELFACHGEDVCDKIAARASAPLAEVVADLEHFRTRIFGEFEAAWSHMVTEIIKDARANERRRQHL